MSEHLYKQFDSELDDLRAQLMRMGGLVEEQVRDATRALVEGDTDLIDRVIARDAEVDKFEIEIDTACTHVIARRQPTAVDLRMIMMVSKTVTDLERIGDEAKKIAKAARKIMERELAVTTPQIMAVRHMGEQCATMLHDVLDAFVRMDANTALDIVRRDKEIDQHFRSITRELVTYMMEDPRTISSALDIIFSVKSLERVGDHAKNIARDVIFIVKGRDVRHLKLDELEQEAAAQ
ncbi:phosphate signaling complex protein PhoU [Sulfuricystis thermophila]|uniref:phosphate signaling complex protein PhoU n=1 Tax=Sulfuricystis thermophila TaxID=2496847 RepID=UPI0010356430|nr:phosphate signaling complex protein PhoU [Sulfuricystis thermophila]